jgi:aspartate ammonia-lyase
MQNKIAGTQSQIEILEYASILKQIAIEVSRICSDLKLLSSGPNT